MKARLNPSALKGAFRRLEDRMFEAGRTVRRDASAGAFYPTGTPAKRTVIVTERAFIRKIPQERGNAKARERFQPGAPSNSDIEHSALISQFGRETPPASQL